MNSSRFSDGLERDRVSTLARRVQTVPRHPTV